MLARVRTSDHNYKVLFSLRPELESNPFREFFGNRVLNKPRLMLDLAVDYAILLSLVLFLTCKVKSKG